MLLTARMMHLRNRKIPGTAAIGPSKLAVCLQLVMQPCGVPKCHNLSQFCSEQPQPIHTPQRSTARKANFLSAHDKMVNTHTVLGEFVSSGRRTRKVDRYISSRCTLSKM